MTWGDGDFNGDGKATAAGAAILAANWGATRETGEPAPAGSPGIFVGPVPSARSAARPAVHPLSAAAAAASSETARDAALAAEFGPQPFDPL